MCVCVFFFTIPSILQNEGGVPPLLSYFLHLEFLDLSFLRFPNAVEAVDVLTFRYSSNVDNKFCDIGKIGTKKLVCVRHGLTGSSG